MSGQIQWWILVLVLLNISAASDTVFSSGNTISLGFWTISFVSLLPVCLVPFSFARFFFFSWPLYVGIPHNSIPVFLSPLCEEMAIHSNILPWRIPWTEESDGLHTVHGVTESQTRLSTHVQACDLTQPQGFKGNLYAVDSWILPSNPSFLLLGISDPTHPKWYPNFSPQT